MNQHQRLVVAVASPLLVLMVALGVADKVGRVHWYDWERTWPVWAIAIIIVAGVEFYLFRE